MFVNAMVWNKTQKAINIKPAHALIKTADIMDGNSSFNQCVKWLGLIWLDPPTQIKSSQNQANQIILNYN